MTIEQEFFEAFGIEPKCITEEIGNILGFCNTAIKYIYPPITPEIVLGLIKIIISKDYVFNIWETNMFTNNDKYIANASNSVRHDIYGRSNTFNDTILSLCIKLKDEIQDQVRELFNEQ